MMQAMPSLFPEPLLMASAESAETMVTSIYMGVWLGMCTIKSILASGWSRLALGRITSFST